MNEIAQAVIDYAEIYILDVKPLTPWQRYVIEQLCREKP